MARFSPISAYRDPFARRVFLYLAAPMFLVSIGFAGVQLWDLERRLERDFTAHGRAQTELLAHAARVPLFAGDRPALHALAEGLLGSGPFRSVRVLDARGRLVVQVDGPPGEPPPASWAGATGDRTGRVHPGFLEFWSPVRGRRGYRDAEDLYFAPPESGAGGAAPLGQLGVLASRAPVRSELAAGVRRYLGITLAFLAVAGLVTLAVMAEATRPLRHLLHRVDEPTGPAVSGDGVARLASRFDSLVAQLDASFATVRRLNDELEERVAARTRDLRGAHLALQDAHDQLEHRVRERTAELERAHAHLRHAEKLTAIGRLASSLAHELNNPICGVRNCVAELRQELAADSEEQQIADLALAECDRMGRLVGSLRQLSRPATDAVEAVDVPPLLDAMLCLTRKQFDRAGIRVVPEYAADLPPVAAAPDQLKQVFLNLLQNACDAMDGGLGTVTLRATYTGGEVLVAVIDQGGGIAPEHLERIFEPFFTTKDAVKGTGLGLAVSHGIVEGFGGRLQVQTTPGRGSTFTVHLPATERPA